MTVLNHRDFVGEVSMCLAHSRRPPIKWLPHSMHDVFVTDFVDQSIIALEEIRITKQIARVDNLDGDFGSSIM